MSWQIISFPHPTAKNVFRSCLKPQQSFPSFSVGPDLSFSGYLINALKVHTTASTGGHVILGQPQLVLQSCGHSHLEQNRVSLILGGASCAWQHLYGVSQPDAVSYLEDFLHSTVSLCLIQHPVEWKPFCTLTWTLLPGCVGCSRM